MATEPTITFGAAQSFGTLLNWKEQSSSPTVTSDRARVLDKDGNQAVSKLHNERTEVTCNYEAGANTGVAILPAEIGALQNALIVTGISVGTNATGHATLTLTGHNHTDNAHSASAVLKKVAHGISSTVGFGAVDFLGGTAGTNADIASSTLDITCEHKDIEAANGNHLRGDNYDAQITSTTVWNGVPSSPANASVWDKITVATNTTNTGHLQTTVTGIKALTLA